eukprot:7831072-Heterocapsa_arctica.AAC.1
MRAAHRVPCPSPMYPGERGHACRRHSREFTTPKGHTAGGPPSQRHRRLVRARRPPRSYRG